MSDWPFTPEVDSGGWQVSDGVDVHDGRPFYYLDPDFHACETALEVTANVNLIAAAPRMYRVLKELLGCVVYSDEFGGHIKIQTNDPTFAEVRRITDWIDGRG